MRRSAGATRILDACSDEAATSRFASNNLNTQHSTGKKMSSYLCAALVRLVSRATVVDQCNAQR